MPAGRYWEWWEIEAIRHIPRGGVAEVARSIGRTVRAVQQMRHERGFTDPRPHWTRADRERFDALVAGGETVVEAAAAIGRPLAGAYNRRYLDRARGDVPPAPPVAEPGRRGYQGQYHREGRLVPRGSRWTRTAISGRVPRFGPDGRIIESDPAASPMKPTEEDRRQAQIRRAIEEWRERQRDALDADLGW